MIFFKKNSNKMYMLIFLYLLSFQDVAWSQNIQNSECQMSKGYKYNFYFDLQSQNIGMYGNNIDQLPPTVIQNCKNSSGKFLGIGLGLSKPYIVSDTANISFDGQMGDEICHLENTPKDLMKSEEKKKILKEQFQMLRSCTFFEFTHLDGKNIQYEPKQDFCTIEKKANGKLIAKGDFCYLKITPDLRVAVSVVMNPQCSDPQFLAQNKIQISDVDSFLQAFVVEDSSGIYIDNQIGSAPVRVSILPTSNLLPINKDVDEDGAKFPTTYGADIHMGSLQLQSGHNGGVPATALRLSLFVDNRAQRTCSKEGLCVGPGDYQVPLASEVTLYEYKNGKRIAIDSWYAGRFLDPFVKSQWQGLYDLGQYIVDGLEMKEDQKYEIEMNFYNPYEDFIMLTTRYQEFTIDYTLLNGTAGKDSIHPLAGINNIKILPTLNNLPPIDDKNELNTEYEKIKQYFRNFSRDTQFPPTYNDICIDGKCLKTQSSGKYLKIKTQFEIIRNKEDGSLQPKNIRIKRDSPIMNPYEIENATLPGVVCQ